MKADIDTLATKIFESYRQARIKADTFYKLFKDCDDIYVIHERAMEYKYYEGVAKGIWETYNEVKTCV